jgi:beta-galactosidase/beta-glucuronidase
MKRIILSALLLPGGFLVACASYGGPVRNEEDLAEAVTRLREKYAPFLRSLPEPMSVRSRRSLDSGDWRSCYELGREGYEVVPLGSKPLKMPEWSASDFDDSGWERTTVPEWRFKTSRPKTKPRPRMKRARLYGCVLWYRTFFEAEEPSEGKRVFLVFGGVDWSAEVWLNGTRLGGHAGYFEPCEETLFGESSSYGSIFPTPTCPGVKGRIVRDRAGSLAGFRKGDPHTGTGYGIHREAYLETVGEACITDVYARGKPGQDRSAIEVHVDAARSMPLNVAVSILPENFKGRAYARLVKHKAGKGAGKVSVDVPMPDAKLWSPAAPYLYRCRVALEIDRGEVVDARDVLFGYRSFAIVSEAKPREGHPGGRMLLNDGPIVLHGSNITGLNALWYWGETERIVDILLMLKAAGYNAVRSCQHVQYPEVRELLDRLGIMSQQDVGSRYPKQGKESFPGLLAAAGALARTTYNNPGVVLHSYANETHFDPTELVRTALEIDPDRVIIPISGHPWQVIGDPAEGRTGYRRLPAELWANVLDDVHTYQGWYGKSHQPSSWTLIYSEDDRLITVGEFGGEGLDAYETMKEYPEHWGAVPPKEARTLRGHVQTKPRDIKQTIGFRGRQPTTLEEHIRASQTVQADILMEVTKGLRLSRRVGGYFQFHFVDVNPATWPKSIVSHDLRPKKAYFAMAQSNQDTVPLPVVVPGGKVMELWVDNDLWQAHERTVLDWSITHDGKVVLDGRVSVDIKGGQSEMVGQVDLSSLSDAEVISVAMKLTDPNGTVLGTYEQEFYLKAYRQ